MKLQRIPICLMLGLAALVCACSSGFSTATNAVTGRSRVYAIDNDAALRVAHDAMAQSLPDRLIEPLDGPAQGYAAHAGSGLDMSVQQVLIHPVTGVTTSGTAVDGYTFDVSGRGTVSTSDINTASFFAELQQALDATGDAVDVVRIEPRTKSP
jgi:hypothetical protein